MILNQCETFSLFGNQIAWPLFDVDQETANDPPEDWVVCRNTVGVITNLAFLGASNGRREARGDLSATQER